MYSNYKFISDILLEFEIWNLFHPYPKFELNLEFDSNWIWINQKEKENLHYSHGPHCDLAPQWHGRPAQQARPTGRPLACARRTVTTCGRDQDTHDGEAPGGSLTADNRWNLRVNQLGAMAYTPVHENIHGTTGKGYYPARHSWRRKLAASRWTNGKWWTKTIVDVVLQL
jgi:hypothetical protein